MAASATPLSDANIVLGVCGGIAAYKSVELLRLLTKAGASVQVVMTSNARSFVGELTFQALSGKPVFTDLFDLTQESEIGHIGIADGADLVIVAPATANAIARMAAGMADDVVTAVVLARSAKLLLAPSMNVNMWNNPLTQDNVRRMVDTAGAAVVGPGDGFLACRWTGPGRLAEPPDIVEAATRLLTEQDLDGRRVVVSAGPTHEALDPVRFLGNRSTGKMGYAVAAAASRRGASVCLVSGPTSLEAIPGVDRVDVVSARDMAEAVNKYASDADVVVMAAAVADFRPRVTSEQKLKKDELAGFGEVSVELEENPDILAGLGEAREGNKPLLVGFAAETESVLDNARKKLDTKKCDMVVANDVSQPDAGFAADTNRVTLVTRNAADDLPLSDKSDVAHSILNRVVTMLAE
jgi:phosphopantothenoylcysteine decarboxylase/phosphopantothenate--cysteine ligase